MQVFKSMFKIMKALLPVVLLYLVLFTIISVLLNISSGQEAVFVQKKAKVAVIDRDGGTLALAITAYLDETNTLVQIADGETAIEDALFFRNAEYIVTIPKGYTERFFSGTEALALGKNVVPDSMNEVYVTMQLDRFLNTVRAYYSNTQGLTLDQIIVQARADLDVETDVIMEVPEGLVNFTRPVTYFNWQVYTLCAVLGLSVTMMMSIFRERSLRMRCSCSGVSARKVSMQQYLFYALFALLVAATEIAVAFVSFGSGMCTVNGGFAILNMLTLTAVYLSMSIMFGSLRISSVGAHALVNVLGLGMSFLSGVFVPQMLLGEGVLIAARFLPTYWFVASNNLLGTASVFNWSVTGQLLGNMLIMLAFAVVFLLVAALINRSARRDN